MQHDYRIKLPRPHLNQFKILESKARFRVVLAGRRFGKTLISHIIAIHHMLKCEHVIYITPTHEYGRRFLKEIGKYLPESLIRSYNQTERRIELVTGGSITFFSGEAGERIRGTGRYAIAVIDEAAFIPNLQTLWTEELLPTLMDCNGKAIFISTPNGQETFHSLWVKGNNGEPEYESFHFTSYDNPKLPEGAVDLLKREMTEAAFKQEILALAGENLTSAFGSADNVNKNVIPILSTGATISYGIDISSGHGNDYTVIIGLDREGIMSYYDRGKWGTELILDKIKALPGNIYKTMDATGAGDAIYQLLQRTVSNLHPFVFTPQSKSEIITKLIKDVELGKVKYLKPIADEMSVYEYKRKPTGHYSYSAKSGFNDDTITALALANEYREKAIQQSTWKPYIRRT